MQRLTVCILVVAAASCTGKASPEASSTAAANIVVASPTASTSNAYSHPEFVAAANHICEQMVAAEAKDPYTPPSRRVAHAIFVGKFGTQGVSSFYIAFIGDALRYTTKPVAEFAKTELPASDQQIAEAYTQTNKRSLNALLALRNAAQSGNADAMRAAYARVQTTSTAVSNMNIAYGLTACGSMDHPAA
jgi:hypothetical protein